MGAKCLPFRSEVIVSMTAEQMSEEERVNVQLGFNILMKY